jgi:hypothetical protein
MIYLITLTLHSWIRWLVLVTGLIAVVRAISGTTSRRPWTPLDDRSAFFFTMMLDLQVLIGLLLYAWLSPLTREAFRDIGAAMKSHGLRFWAVEHIFGMIVALAIAHVGRARIRKADPSRRHRVALTFFGLAFLVIVASIPWPGAPYGRPLLRW